MTLPYDYCRCPGKNCPIRDQCDRYLSRNDCGPWTPIDQFDPKDCKDFIEVKNADN